MKMDIGMNNKQNVLRESQNKGKKQCPMPGALGEYDDYVAVFTQHIKLRGL